MTDVSDNDSKLLTALNVSMAAFSFIGSTFIITCFIKFKELRSFAYRLVLWVAISDWWNAIGNMMGDVGGYSASESGPSRSSACRFQAILISYFELTSILWSAAIAFTLHLAFLREDTRFSAVEIDSRARWYHVTIWCIPLVLTMLPLTTDSYGDTGGWCWILGDSAADKAWRFIQFYIPLWICVVYSSYVYIQVVRKFHALAAASLAAGGPSEDKSHNVRAMKFYPLVMVICYFWATVNRLYQTFGGGFVLWLNGIHVFFSSSQGLGNFIVYVNTAQVQSRLRVFLAPYFTCVTLRDVDRSDSSEVVARTAADGAVIDDSSSPPSHAALAPLGADTKSPAGVPSADDEEQLGFRDMDASAASTAPGSNPSHAILPPAALGTSTTPTSQVREMPDDVR